MNNIPPGEVIDLGKLKNARSEDVDEQCANLIAAAAEHEAPDNQHRFVDSEATEEFFVFGYTQSLLSFTTITTNGMVEVPAGVLSSLAYAAWVEQRGMQWVFAVASYTDEPTDQMREAFRIGRRAADHHHNGLKHLRDQIGAAMQHAERLARDKAAIITGMDGLS